MTTARDLASIASLLADETRAALCLALLDGRAWTAGELARHVGVAPSTTTAHLHRLVGGGLLTEHRQGRHRYVALADASVADLLEDLSARVEPRPAPPRGLRAVTADAALRRGRTCYDHLAGGLGVAVTDALVRDGLLDADVLTPAGTAWFTDTLGAPLRPGRRPTARRCLDWTERRPHLAGAAGAALCAAFLRTAWIRRVGSGRAVRVTADGTAALTALFGPDPRWEDLPSRT
ncbi:ArsR/SmtB family transcription factor [Cryptosporangium arvum]|uniref:ArsR/SmtB family transcription factor n=1 Tax=Cryptosporangium arvum TaxID=80871 RepID=UPI0004B5D8D3|nr:winged helix-turn-helix domain-containing protein [Cryptosporangium arvum]